VQKTCRNRRLNAADQPVSRSHGGKIAVCLAGEVAEKREESGTTGSWTDNFGIASFAIFGEPNVHVVHQPLYDSALIVTRVEILALPSLRRMHD
jgi:hypothetical protein